VAEELLEQVEHVEWHAMQPKDEPASMVTNVRAGHSSMHSPSTKNGFAPLGSQLRHSVLAEPVHVWHSGWQLSQVPVLLANLPSGVHDGTQMLPWELLASKKGAVPPQEVHRPANVQV